MMDEVRAASWESRNKDEIAIGGYYKNIWREIIIGFIPLGIAFIADIKFVIATGFCCVCVFLALQGCHLLSACRRLERITAQMIEWRFNL